jgi:hypothetical protein
MARGSTSSDICKLHIFEYHVHSLHTQIVPELQLDQIQNNAKCPSVWWGSSCVFEGWGSSDCRPDLALRSQMLMSQLYIWLDMADIRRRLAAHIPEARKALLLTEIDRVGQVNPNFSTVLLHSFVCSYHCAKWTRARLAKGVILDYSQ